MNQTDRSSISLSVIVIVLEGKKSLQACLRALLPQVQVLEGEILVPYDARFPEIPSCVSEFPEVEFFELDGMRTFAELRSYGVKRGKGRIVAITEDQCRPASNWCQEILSLHAQSHVAIGGVVEKEVPDSPLNWTFFFADYLRYMTPISEGIVHHLTDCNVSYKRAALEQIAKVWSAEFHEPDVHHALESGGGTLWLSPSIVVYQHRDMTISRALKDRFSFGRLFGSGRVTHESGVKRIIRGGVAMLTPPLTVGRITAQVFQKERWIKEFVLAFPYILLLNTVWALGETVGCITGTPPAWLKPTANSSSHESGTS